MRRFTKSWNFSTGSGTLTGSREAVCTVQCADGTSNQVTDPGRATITGKGADIGKVKGPILRGLAERAPYFHNGVAATLNDVVEFYNQRFNLNLTALEKSDLVAFLRTL